MQRMYTHERSGALRSHQHIVAVFVVEVHVEGQGVLEPAHLYAEVPLMGGFPPGIDVGGFHLDDVAAALDVAGVVDMATHSSILACRILLDRGAWRATVHGVA